MDREETDRTLVHCRLTSTALTNTALTGSATDGAVGAVTVTRTRGVRSAAQGRRAGAGLASLEG